VDERDESFAELAVEKGLASREQAAECAQAVRKAAELGAVAKLPDTMVGKGYLTREQADGLLAELKRREAKVPALAGYELLSRIGSGGMGVVYKARQVAMDRIVALKILKPSLSRDRTFVARFLREARSAAKLNHPNIVQGIDAGQAEGYHYFVMEFVDGPTVAQRLRGEQVLGEKESLRIVRDVASALEHAEGHGIVHRDIKPDNVMLTSEGAAKLADLGLAKRAEAEAALTLEARPWAPPTTCRPSRPAASATSTPAATSIRWAPPSSTWSPAARRSAARRRR